MIGLKVKYAGMMGTVIDENKTHLLIEFKDGTKYCVGKAGIDKDNFFEDNLK